VDKNYQRFMERTAGRLVVDSIRKHNPNPPQNKGPRGRVIRVARLDGCKPMDRFPGTINLGLNAPCKCGSGKKYKRCCVNKDIETVMTRRMPEPRSTGKVLGAEDASLVNEATHG